MPDYANLGEAAEASPAIRDILLSGTSHTDAAVAIAAAGYPTSEASVRRWRKAQLLLADQDVADDDELYEDAGNGLYLGEISNDISPGWDGFSDQNREALHRRLDETISAVNADASAVTGLRVSQYETITKDARGDAQKHKLYSVKLLVRTSDPVPEWPLVSPAPAMQVHPVPPAPARTRSGKVAVILPDPQIGYRFFIDDQSFDPFHDENALDISLQVIRDIRPDLVLCLGDFLDFPAFSKYEQEAAFAQTTQRAVNRAAEYLGQIRAVAPDARLAILEGNHDRRLQKMITANALSAFGLRQAMDTTGWPVLSVPFLCNFTDLNAEYVQGYPAGSFWLNDRLRAIHGSKVRSGAGASTAAAVVRDDDVSTIFGHIHRVELQNLTRSGRRGGRTLIACSPGCLCRVDGSVPSMRGSTDLTGRAVESYENWQQGLAVVEYDDGDRPFHITLSQIATFDGYETRLFGKAYLPNTMRET